jgi:hypothetical protein
MNRKRINKSPLPAERVTEQIGQHVEDELLRGNRGEHPHSGQPCPRPGCDGMLHVESTRVIGGTRRRYLKCRKCGVAPENHIQLVPLEYAPRQSPRTKRFFVLPVYLNRLAE